MAITVGSLFSGIGGIDLGLERAGMVTRWFCEIDPHCRNVLTRHWPGLPIYGDITAVDWSGVERVDVLAGGFPCQPVSNAGKRLGQDDARWLWPEFARAIRQLRPRYVLVENVAALLGRGFDEVITDLAALGYDAEWDCIPAAAVGAPHLRDRLWVIAYAGGSRRWKDTSGAPRHEGEDAGWTAQNDHQPRSDGSGSYVANPDAAGRRIAGEGDSGERISSGRDSISSRGVPYAILSGLEGHDLAALALAAYRRQHTDPAGPGWWAAEPELGRVADGIPHRVDRLRALGNAVVPQVVEWIGRRIVAFDEGRVAA